MRFDFTTHDIVEQISLVWNKAIQVWLNQIETSLKITSPRIQTKWGFSFHQLNDRRFTAALRLT
jgi:hypothetical protein